MGVTEKDEGDRPQRAVTEDVGLEVRLEGVSDLHGRVKIERGALSEGEPVFLVVGHDLLAPYSVQQYAVGCRIAATAQSDPEAAERLRQKAFDAERVAAQMIAWQASYPEKTKLPD